MFALTGVRWSAAIAATLLSLLGGGGTACAEGFSGLRGQELRPFADQQEVIGGMLRGLFSDEAAHIDAVSVEEDDEERLTLRVRGTRLNGKLVVGEVLGADKAVQRQVSSPRTRVPDTGEATGLTLTLATDAAEGTDLHSAYLRLRVLREGRALAEAQQMFHLPKRWQRAVPPENLTVRVVMRPEGAAARLREDRPQLVIPRLRPVMAVAMLAAPALEVDTNRPGMDFRSFDLSTADPKLCEQACARDNRCRSFTYVKPGVQGRNARCWLKSGVPASRRDTCCVSGLKAAPQPSPTPSPAPAAGAPLIARPLLISPRLLATPAPVKPAVTTLAASPKLMLDMSRFKFGIPAEDQGKGARGPAAMPIDLVSQIGFEAGQDPGEVMRIWPQVYQDRNPASGVFYFMPKAYHLQWDPVEGYGLRMLYGAATGDGAAGGVVMAASLSAGVDSGDIAFVGDLLRAWQKRHPGSVYSELRRLPIDKPPEIGLAGGLQQVYNIPPDKIAINAISDALGEIDVQWLTDPVTKENLQIALVEDVGINGSLTFTPAGGALPPQRIPVSIQLADSATFGDFRWQRGQTWRNQTPYPIRLRYMHALLFEDDLPIVYSWHLGDTTVPPKAQAEFDAAGVPRWLDGRAKRMWLDYGVERDCAACDREVIATLTGGVSTLGAAPVVFHTLTPLADLNAAEMSVMVRSRFFDARSREPRQLGPLVLNADASDFRIGPLYQDPDATGPLFEYRIELVLKDGTTFTGDTWVPSDKLRVVVGTAQVRQSLGRLPGE